MKISWLRHIAEEALAEIATDDLAPTQLSPSDRQHLETCDRCLGLVDGHRLASRTSAAPWQSRRSGSVRLTATPSAIGWWCRAGAPGSGSGARRPTGFIVVTLLLAALAGSAVLVGTTVRPQRVPAGARRQSESMDAPTTRRPILGPIDTSTWQTFESDLYGLTMARPADWRVAPAST